MNKKQDPKKFLEQTYDAALDKLYTRLVRCPYCRNKIQKMQTTCSRCGLHKIQIAHASNKRAKEMMKSGNCGKIVMMRHRPSDLKLGTVVLRLAFGIFGVHNFYTGRRIRGWIMLGLMIAFIIQALIFPLGDINNNLSGMHPWREAVMVQQGMPFPLDFLGVAALIMWISDVFGIVFGWYKYPVRLGETSKNA